MSWTALPNAVSVVFGKALVCGRVPALAGATGRADGFAGAGVVVGAGFSLASLSGLLGAGLLAAGAAECVAFTWPAVTFAPDAAPALQPARAAASSPPATATWTLTSRLSTKEEFTPAGSWSVAAVSNVVGCWQTGVMAVAGPGGADPVSSGAALDGFSTATRAWFEGAFAVPTQAQAQAWRAIGKGDDTLVIAPTGSGKTLAACLWV